LKDSQAGVKEQANRTYQKQIKAMIHKYNTLIISAVIAAIPIFAAAQKTMPVVVSVDQPKALIQPTMWGIFFEDINFAADGGLYAELIKNRSFEFYKPKTGWKVTAESHDSSEFVIINRGDQNEANPRFARITAREGISTFCLTNYGFRGMGIKKDNQYNFTIQASAHDNGTFRLRIELVSEKGEKIGEAMITPQGKEWKKYAASLVAIKTDLRARLNIWFEGHGIIDIDMVSLFPNDTWKNRPNGLRADLVQLLADMKPGFLRFPGGCIVEGYNLGVRYQWKKTIGSVDTRQMIINRWNTEFAHRLTPDYYQSFGLGFYEYFLLAEDIGAEPLPILNCGMACQFNSAELVPVDQLEPYIQDALDLIEFANGPASSKWGEVRSDMGHPEPFHMKYLGIGNEQWGPQYIERLVIFEKTIKAKYPDIILVSSAGPQPDGDLFNFASGELKKLDADIVDEHYYRNPAWFFSNASRYDGYDRKSYKVFAGEYAAQSVATTSPDNRNSWECALSEAAFMTGLERNADVVYMCSYAPLLAHVDGWQWTPDLIWFNNLISYGTTNYYVQNLFGNNKGTHVLNMLQNDKPLTGQNGLYATAALDKNSKEIILKLVNNSGNSQPASMVLQTKAKLEKRAKLTVLKGELSQVNSIDNPGNVKPVEQEIDLKGKKVEVSLSPYSFSVIRIKMK
jgi:alpha-L-arabinofuranosidase